MGRRVRAKPIKNTPYRLFYDPEQHQTFLKSAVIDYEPETMAAARSAVSPGDLVFDVGANIGQYSLPLSAEVGPEGRVVAFEPGDAAAAMLARNLRENDIQNVTIDRSALGATAGTGQFHVDIETGGRSSSFRPEALRGNRAEAVEVEIITLAQAFERYGRPNFIKIDVERLEVEVVKGLPDDISGINFIIEVRRDTRIPIFEHFAARGFRCVAINEQISAITRAEHLPDAADLMFLSPQAGDGGT